MAAQNKTASTSKGAVPAGAESGTRNKALEAALSQIERAFGKGSIMKMGDRSGSEQIEVISSGSLGIDLALGIGGMPKGRIVELYGPESSGKTTLALHVIAEAQKAGGTCAFIDAEHALDPVYARKLGVDVDNLLLSQPDGGEQALEICDTLTRSGALSVIVIDSVAALVPRAELEGEMGDTHVGLHARLMSQALRKLTGSVSKTNTMIIFINQIRMKIGVMFGCFHYSSRVALADGTSEKIGKIVNRRIPAEVMSYDRTSGRIVPRLVTNWYNNGDAERFLQLTVAGGPSGRRTFGVTENHIVITPQGERDAGSLLPGDVVCTARRDLVLGDGQRQMLLGGCIGDTAIRVTGTGSATFRFGHGSDQASYLAWKRAMLSDFAQGDWTRADGSAGFDVSSNKTAFDMYSRLYGPGDGSGMGRVVSAEHFELMGERALAVWYLDDGTFGGCHEKWGNGRVSFATKSLDDASRARACLFLGRFGIDVGRIHLGRLELDSVNTRKLHETIAPWVHPSMEHKLHPACRGRFMWPFDPLPVDGKMTEMVLSHDIVLSVAPKPVTRSMRRFDIQVDKNHVYFVDGVMVHNSPETTTGGNALKFYASIRMEIRRIGQIKDRDEVVGNQTRVKVVKNKLAPPFRQVEFDIMYGEGISKVGELVDLGVKAGVVEKSGAWFSCDSVRIGQGRENAKQYLREHPETAAMVEKKVRDQSRDAPLDLVAAILAEIDGDAVEADED